MLQLPETRPKSTIFEYMRVLIVEDEKTLNEAICDFLHGSYICDSALTKFAAEDLILQYNYDVVVLDINLPDGTGLELLRWMQERETSFGILIISARDSLDHRIEGLEAGADDYLVKPFHLAELNARINAIIRRKKYKGPNTLRFNEIELIPTQKKATVHEKTLDLTPKQYDILEFFILNQNKIVSKETVVDHLWYGESVSNQSLEFIYNHVKNIRNMIRRAGGNDYIKTVYGLGYRFTDE